MVCMRSMHQSRMMESRFAFLHFNRDWLLKLSPLFFVQNCIDGDMNAIDAVLNEEQRREFQQPVAIEVKKGEAAFHHPRLVHGSHANHSDRSRRATVINVMKDGVRSASNEPLLQGVPAISAGEKVEGRFFPLLYAPAARS